MDDATKKLMGNLRQMMCLLKRRKFAMPDGIKTMTLAQFEVMEYLIEQKRARMSDIAKEAGVKLPTMTELVDKLVRRGLLQRQSDELDRRTVWITIVPSVEKFAMRMMKKHEQYITQIMAVLTKEEKSQAIKIVSKLINRLEKDINNIETKKRYSGRT